MSFADDFREFAFDLARTQSRLLAGIPDSPQRTAPPEGGPERPAFDQLPLEERLDAAERLCRRPYYREALLEAFGEHQLSPTFFAMILDSGAPAAAIGELAREMALSYLECAAERRGEDIQDFL